jgi:hypothetical protein
MGSVNSRKSEEMMKQGSNKRSRSRGSNKRHNNPRGHYESNGSEVKVRGTSQQILEKYLALARDATLAGDRVTAEGYFQFAEHYFRVGNADGAASSGQGQGRRDSRNNRGASQSDAREQPVQQSSDNTQGEGDVEIREIPVVEKEAEPEVVEADADSEPDVKQA